jgi:undecaprenyl-diphosphatase
MTYLQGLVLGVVQGVTEFLPISSSGHLVLVPYLFGWPDQGLAFDAVMHLGTFAALVAYFRVELLAMFLTPGAAGAVPSTTGSRRLAVLLLVATIPAAVAGFAFEQVIEARLRLPLVVALSTLGWALVMLAADRLAARTPDATRGEENVGWGQGLITGCAQALALIPGTSRSGITITAGLLSGLDRATAARFSFLLGIPVTAAAGGVKALELLKTGVSADERGPLAVALIAAFLSGWASVWFLVNYLQRNSLVPFVVYRIALGIVLLAIVVRLGLP